jgi:FKBP-type peptidyl-prolyl cis-trans isomerase
MKLHLIALSLAGIAGAAAYSSSSLPSGRRAFLQTGAGAAATAASVIVSGGAAQPAFAEDGDYADFETTESGLRYKVTKEGTGAVPEAGQTVKAHYTGWLDGFDSIKKFDSSRDRGRPFSFRVGAGQVIRGWDETFASMKVGERRQIIIPSRLG